ncbi:ATP-binding cassette domain-containing protein [Streptomyces goshikiensis]|uniref:ATP-binding cassette domain-containing protein n=1 Tax=Streptomyces goshikiensis TaxID=1942 RepID=UPI003D9E5A26
MPYRTLRRPLLHLGALLDASALQPSRTARNHLLWLAHSQGAPPRRVDEVIEQAGLGTAARRKAGGFSLGMRQRLEIAAALLGDPPVVMLDEPFNRRLPVIWHLRCCSRRLPVTLQRSGSADRLSASGRHCGRRCGDTIAWGVPLSRTAPAMNRASPSGPTTTNDARLIMKVSP